MIVGFFSVVEFLLLGHLTTFLFVCFWLFIYLLILVLYVSLLKGNKIVESKFWDKSHLLNSLERTFSIKIKIVIIDVLWFKKTQEWVANP